MLSSFGQKIRKAFPFRPYSYNSIENQDSGWRSAPLHQIAKSEEHPASAYKNEILDIISEYLSSEDEFFNNENLNY